MVGNVIGTQLVQIAQVNLRNRMAELYSMAETLSNRHLEFIKIENKNRTWEEKSILFVKPRLRDNTLAVTWYEVSWYGSKALKTRRMVKTVIVKPKHKYGYNMETLLKQARGWEANTVREIENDLIPIRREAEFIGAALAKLNQVSKETQ